MVRKPQTLIQRYRHWKYSHKSTIDSIVTTVIFYGILFMFAMLASADAICNRWMPFCIGWFD